MFKNVTVWAILFVILTTSSTAQAQKPSASFGSAGTAALAYFERIPAQSFASYLKSIRPGKISPQLKAKFITMFPKQDIVTPSAEGRAKLAALEPILKYYGRAEVIDLLVLRLGQAAVLFLAGAAVLISEEALNLLTAKELQGIVAHELGHEYFWNEWQQARLDKQYSKIQEIELRCDGLAVIVMNQLGLDPSPFTSAVTKLAKSHSGRLVNVEYYPSFDERIRFILTMIAMVNTRGAVFGPMPSKE